MKSVTVSLPGTCGELFQGTLDGVPCLVSCPVDRMARLEVSLEDGEGLSVPPEMLKTRRALEALFAKQPQADTVRVRRLEALPEGKGYASSTADILAGLYGFSELSGLSLSPEEASSIALSVEPTDSIAWPGLALLDHREGRIMEFLGPPPPMALLVIDEGGVVDTEEFNRGDRRSALASLAAMHREAFGLLKEGVRRGDPAAIGEAASLSSEACLRLLDKPLLERCRSLSRSLGGYGVCVAHSGTLYGILLPVSVLDASADCPACPEALYRGESALREAGAAILEMAARALPDAAEIRLHALVHGGPRFASSERKV